MYLNNFKISLNIYNETIGIITNINIKTNLIQVSFNILEEIINTNIKLIINHFTINENQASHYQFLFQNYYILIVYKT